MTQPTHPSAAAAADQTAAAGGDPRRAWKVLAVTSVAVFMSFLDVTIVNIAFPNIQRSFPGDSFAGLSWILNGYNVVFAALLVPAGRLGDRLGRRRIFFVGLTVFLGASAVCGVAPSVPVLVGARVVQAAGAALIVPSSLALVLPEFPLHRRATATAIWSAAGAVAAATGPSLGGVLVHATSWRWVFYVNLAIGLPALIPARRLLTETKRDTEGAIPDVLGAGLLVVGVGAVALGLVQGHAWGWGGGRVLGAVAGGLAVLAVFLVRSARHPAPVVELALFRVRSFSVSVAAVFVYAMGFYALLLSNILFLTGVWHYSILRAGFAVTPGPLTAAAMGVLGGVLSDRFGQRAVAIPGGLLFGAGCALFALRLGATPHYASVFLIATLTTGAGVGLTFASLGSAAVAELPPSRFATGSAVSNCLRQVGAVLGISALVAVLGQHPSLHVFHNAYGLMAGTGVAMALIAVGLGRVRAREGALAPAPMVVEGAAR
jgi:EmrB/QacA subfamily drug resistance transporter